MVLLFESLIFLIIKRFTILIVMRVFTSANILLLIFKLGFFITGPHEVLNAIVSILTYVFMLIMQIAMAIYNTVGTPAPFGPFSSALIAS